MFHVEQLRRITKMNQPTVYQVTRLNDIDKTHYKEGDFFMTDRSLAVLMHNEIKTIPLDLEKYVTKKDLQQALKKEGDDNES